MATATHAPEWHGEAISLRAEGLSEREIAEAVGRSASSVHSVLKKHGAEKGEPKADGEPEAPAEPDTQAEPDASSANGNGHLSPYHAERGRLEDLGSHAGEGDGPNTSMGVDEAVHAQARISDSGDTEWESESVFVPLTELRVDGTAQLGLFDSGGKRPQDSSLRLQGGRVMLADGQAFKKGDVVRLEVTAVVREVAQRDKPDPATGIVVSAEQKHVAYITDLRVIA